ncbi:hypothetical protein U1Q18_012421, partial [Sarracenia purpurea var. burkii]
VRLLQSPPSPPPTPHRRPHLAAVLHHLRSVDAVNPPSPPSLRASGQRSDYARTYPPIFSSASNDLAPHLRLLRRPRALTSASASASSSSSSSSAS